MTSIRARGGASKQTISAIVTRANGKVEDLGVISYWHKSWFKRVLFRLFGIV